MARKVQILLSDDLDGQSPADETIQFSIDDATYEIDLTEQHAEEMRQAFARYTAAAHKATKAKSTAKKTSQPKARKSTTADVRVWAREHGHEVSDRGRVPLSIVREYEASH